MPGDLDIEYASPWAGANFMPYVSCYNGLGTWWLTYIASMSAKPGSRWERATWPYLKRLATNVPEAGIHLQSELLSFALDSEPMLITRSDCRLYRRGKDEAALRGDGTMLNNVFASDPWYRGLVDDYRVLTQTELPEGIASGSEFGSVCINPALYLPWLVGQCRANGVTFHRKTVAHVLGAQLLSADGVNADIIINATGLSAQKLGGVLDTTMYPIRGQTVVVRNVAPYMAVESGTDDGKDQATYLMTRAAGGGTILGGTLQVGSWDSQIDLDIASQIMQRAVKLVPALTESDNPENLDIIRHGVGLRPGRDGGVRLEKEKINGVWVVHNYGHAGWGYQGSYGCAEEVVNLTNSISAIAKL